MVQTRNGTKSGADAQQKQAARGKDNQPPAAATSPSNQHKTSPSSTKAKKRKSTSDETTLSTSKVSKASKRNTSSTKPPATSASASTPSQKQAQQPSEKPRLTTPDLEFDYDRTQLRDPRPTPGRNARPRYGSIDIPEDLKAHLEATREIPGPPPRPKGRLTSAVKEDMFVAETRVNPLATFHDLYKCYDKGRDGSPTYDEAGFQLDYDKVVDWMKPQAYNKKRIVNGMERRVEKIQKEEEQIFGMFFAEKWDDEKGTGYLVKEFVCDHVSKDLGIPWHQIGPEEVKQWKEKGFEPVKFAEWWKEPGREDMKRIMKLGGGASLRKNL